MKIGLLLRHNAGIAMRTTRGYSRSFYTFPRWMKPPERSNTSPEVLRVVHIKTGGRRGPSRMRSIRPRKKLKRAFRVATGYPASAVQVLWFFAILTAFIVVASQPRGLGYLLPGRM